MCVKANVLGINTKHLFVGCVISCLSWFFIPSVFCAIEYVVLFFLSLDRCNLVRGFCTIINWWKSFIKHLNIRHWGKKLSKEILDKLGGIKITYTKNPFWKSLFHKPFTSLLFLFFYSVISFEVTAIYCFNYKC